MPSINAIQTTTVSTSDAERDLTARMRFMKLNAALDVETLRRETPYGTVELLDPEAGRRHCMKKVRPGHFAWLNRFRGSMEYSGKHLECAVVDCEGWLFVGLMVMMLFGGLWSWPCP